MRRREASAWAVWQPAAVLALIGLGGCASGFPVAREGEVLLARVDRAATPYERDRLLALRADLRDRDVVLVSCSWSFELGYRAYAALPAGAVALAGEPVLIRTAPGARIGREPDQVDTVLGTIDGAAAASDIDRFLDAEGRHLLLCRGPSADVARLVALPRG